MQTMLAKGTLLSGTVSPDSAFSNLEDYERSEHSLIGKGSFGRVFLMKHKVNGNLIAVKVLPKSAYMVNSGKAFKLLKQEIEIHKRLVHPNIIRLYNHTEDLRSIYLLMEYADKGTLANHLQSKSRLDEKEAFAYFRQVCDAVSFLHSCNLAHRDIKPDNVLLTQKSEAKLSDFGCCTCLELTEKRLCGTPEYIAPEAIQTKEYQDKSDVWSLGVLLYEMLYGKVPFSGSSIEDIFKSIVAHELVLDSSISESAKDLLLKLLSKNPASRPRMEEVMEHEWMKEMGEKSKESSIFDKIISFFGGN
eukprot:TRINITY_DN12353_c0_g1_i13.p1 TRINITY_DN12353_c0_g1~~TRINITY_DN12353_c0_g1_i13.p1  ORF type:complete len:304 (+),score=84.18 TRINITY_DN12353_c0_g1_i13:150-1061(+)